jgi:holin-like protein
MLAGLSCLFLFQLLGEVIVRSLVLPFPGPVVGMLLFFVMLLIRGSIPETLRTTSSTLLQHLMLLLVPATAAVMLHFRRIGDEWLPIVLAGLGGTVVTMAVTALTLNLLLSRRKGRGNEP